MLFGKGRGVPKLNRMTFSSPKVTHARTRAHTHTHSHTHTHPQSVVDRQWETLKTRFLRPDIAIVFHLTNHYALLFARA